MEFAAQPYEEAAAVFRSLIGPVRSEPGCSATRLLRDAEENCVLTWVEEWQCVLDFENHLRSPAFRRILAVMELAAAKPTVEIDNVSSRRGFDLVEEILNRSKGLKSTKEMETT
jgi:quinol monooxygenase YgiN